MTPTSNSNERPFSAEARTRRAAVEAWQAEQAAGYDAAVTAGREPTRDQKAQARRCDIAAGKQVVSEARVAAETATLGRTPDHVIRYRQAVRDLYREGTK